MSSYPFIILASTSPRRAELLTLAGVKFEIKTGQVKESRLAHEPPVDYVRRLAQDKALAANSNGLPVLAADTIVFMKNSIFEKPCDELEAISHLKALSGRTHKVVTAFCLLDAAGKSIAHETVISEVTFRKLSYAEIHAYVALNESLDKAGAYAVQGKGMILIDCLSGSYTNIVGLPVPEVLAALDLL